MKVSTITCPTCKQIIFSRARHDMRFCQCGDVAIDGGRDYTKISWGLKYQKHQSKIPEIKLIEISYIQPDLFDDWNQKIDKLGIIQEEK